MSEVNGWCRQQLAPPSDNPIARQQASDVAHRQLDAIARRAGPIQSWSGRLVAIRPYSLMIRSRGEDENGADLTIAADSAPDVRVTEYQDTIPPTAYLIARVGSSSPMYTAAGRMNIGRRVQFSGRVLRGPSSTWAPFGGTPLLGELPNGRMMNSDSLAGCGAPFSVQLTGLRAAP